ncbi:GntR family transcriptional regulator, partial [Pseudomonas sp. 2822-17]|uniref:GntR family transcriptional regulator n=1 Tax=Pseudomonas sp. 2822-17 TaxID=1712678 RepID=UPI0034D22E89
MIIVEITFLLNEQSKEPLYLQIYQYFKTEIQVGNIATGTRLPSIRRLSSHLKVSKNT